ncbi:MAG TPA: glycosyltransferase, partial [Candidatus Saccharimonadales bacterium]
MNHKTPLISIVVLNWNGLEDTRECLASLRKLTYPNVEIIVVDNGSEDGSKKFFSKEKGIVYVDLDKNYGFTGGHIKGFEVA